MEFKIKKMTVKDSREIKKRFSPETVNELLMSKWWDWDQEKILAEKDFFFKNYKLK